MTPDWGELATTPEHWVAVYGITLAMLTAWRSRRGKGLAVYIQHLPPTQGRRDGPFRFRAINTGDRRVELKRLAVETPQGALLELGPSLSTRAGERLLPVELDVGEFAQAMVEQNAVAEALLRVQGEKPTSLILTAEDGEGRVYRSRRFAVWPADLAGT
jgi:hypothetical protein